MLKVINNMEANIDETLGHPTTSTDEESTSELVSSVIRMSCSNFDAATEFEIPAEALEAEDLTNAGTDDTQSTDNTQDTDNTQGAAGAEDGSAAAE